MNYSGYERRLTLRLLAYWEKRRQGRALPALADVEPADLQDFWPDCFILHFSSIGVGTAHTFTYRGGDVAPWLEVLLNEHLAVVQASGEPFVHEGEYLADGDKVLKYRFCLLPLGEQGQVRGVLGGLRAKNFENSY
jgi:hypothetical protein